MKDVAPAAPDQDVLALARRLRALLITADKGFGDLVYVWHRPSAGVLLLRLAMLSPSTRADRVAATLAEHGARLLHAFSVLDPQNIRIRSLPEGTQTDDAS